jgi:hypothetical protein
MSEGAIFLNSGPLFSGEQLASLEERPEWSGLDEAARTAYEVVKETFERHSTLLAGNPSVEETRFHMVTPTLHTLGFTHSAFEPLSLGSEGGLIRVDYACFANAEEFGASVDARETVGFFRNALTVVRAVGWGQNLDNAVDNADGSTDVRPAMELDLIMRHTGVRYGILTNGCDWRLYHHSTSGTLTTYFHADMIAAMKSDFEDFKTFYLIFNKHALTVDKMGRCFLDSLIG